MNKQIYIYIYAYGCLLYFKKFRTEPAWDGGIFGKVDVFCKSGDFSVICDASIPLFPFWEAALRGDEVL